MVGDEENIVLDLKVAGPVTVEVQVDIGEATDGTSGGVGAFKSDRFGCWIAYVNDHRGVHAGTFRLALIDAMCRQCRPCSEHEHGRY
ncbi:MAG: hypothetical protein ACRDWH_08375 [Acidimicrobiia bacterium]